MKKLFFILFFLATAFSTSAQISQSAVKTSTESGRYEIIQSEIKRSNTFMLDKTIGEVFQLVERKDGSYTWEKMFRMKSPYEQTYNTGINYQIFMGGMMVADTYLIDVNLGIVWLLVKDKDNNLLWEIME